MNDNAYDPFDVYADLDADRLKEVEGAKRKNDLSLQGSRQGEEVQNVQLCTEGKESAPGDYGEPQQMKRGRGRPRKADETLRKILE